MLRSGGREFRFGYGYLELRKGNETLLLSKTARRIISCGDCRGIIRCSSLGLRAFILCKTIAALSPAALMAGIDSEQRFDERLCAQRGRRFRVQLAIGDRALPPGYRRDAFYLCQRPSLADHDGGQDRLPRWRHIRQTR